FFFFFQAEDGIRDLTVTGVQTCALPISHRAIHQGLTGVDTNGDVGNFFFDQAKLRDALAESLALFRIADGVLQRGARAAHAARAQLEAADVKDVEGNGVTFADLAQHVFE